MQLIAAESAKAQEHACNRLWPPWPLAGIAEGACIREGQKRVVSPTQEKNGSAGPGPPWGRECSKECRAPDAVAVGNGAQLTLVTMYTQTMNERKAREERVMVTVLARIPVTYRMVAAGVNHGNGRRLPTAFGSKHLGLSRTARTSTAHHHRKHRRSGTVSSNGTISTASEARTRHNNSKRHTPMDTWLQSL